MMTDFDLLGRIVRDRADKQSTIKPIDSVPINGLAFSLPLVFHSDHRSDSVYKNPVEKNGKIKSYTRK